MIDAGQVGEHVEGFPVPQMTHYIRNGVRRNFEEVLPEVALTLDGKGRELRANSSGQFTFPSDSLHRRSGRRPMWEVFRHPFG